MMKCKFSSCKCGRDGLSSYTRHAFSFIRTPTRRSLFSLYWHLAQDCQIEDYVTKSRASGANCNAMMVQRPCRDWFKPNTPLPPRPFISGHTPLVGDPSFPSEAQYEVLFYQYFMAGLVGSPSKHSSGK